jgi:hypothetical protein
VEPHFEITFAGPRRGEADQNILQQAVCPELPPSDAIFSDGFES